MSQTKALTKERERQKQRVDATLEVGKWVGRKQAFALMAGRCSAADAECLRRIRDKKEYRALDLSWAEFCKRHMGIERSTADRIVRQLEEFGPEFFALTQVTRITVDEYRAIAASVHGHCLLHAGEEIAIEVENAPRLAAAIEALRPKKTPAAPRPALLDPRAEVDANLPKVERWMDAALTQLERLNRMSHYGDSRLRLRNAVGNAFHRLEELYREV